MSSGFTGLRTKIDKMIGTLYQIEVVFYHNDTVSSFYKGIKGSNQLSNIMKVETCGGFIKDKEHFFFGSALTDKRSQFDPLCFPTRKGSRGLSKGNIAQSNILEWLKFLVDFFFLMFFEKSNFTIYRHI